MSGLIRGSMRRRLTLWYSSALAVLLVAFAAVSLSLFKATLSARSDSLLWESSDLFVHELVAEYGEFKTPLAAIDATIREVQFRDIVVTVFDARGTAIARNRAAHWPVAPSILDATGDTFYSLPGEEGGQRALIRRAMLGDVRVVLAFLQPQAALRETMEHLFLGYVVAIPVFLSVAALGGYFLAHRAIAPIASMSQQARAIGASTLHERLPVPSLDEVGSLAVVINELLGRLQQSFELQRRFVADASHELRTSVAIVRAESEIALNRETRSEAEYREALGVTLDGARRLTRIVDDLLLLARADEGRQVMQPAALYLDEIVVEVVRAMRALADERRIRILVGALPEAPTTGDPGLVHLLILNLLDNAVKYAPEGTVVEVSLSRNNDRWRIAVADQGPGIPPELHGAIFDRFYRADRARFRVAHTTTSGAGLGLAIARWVAEVHGGTLTLARSGKTGSVFTAELPAQG